MSGLWLICFLIVGEQSEVIKKDETIYIFDKGYQLEECKYHVQVSSSEEIIKVEYCRNGVTRKVAYYDSDKLGEFISLLFSWDIAV